MSYGTQMCIRFAHMSSRVDDFICTKVLTAKFTNKALDIIHVVKCFKKIINFSIWSLLILSDLNYLLLFFRNRIVWRHDVQIQKNIGRNNLMLKD